MLTYKAPLKDIGFLMNEVFDYPKHYQSLQSGQLADPETVQMVVQGMADFAQNVVAPLYQSGDAQGCHFDNGQVTTPTGFKEAYKQFVQDGWHGICYPQSYGGMGLPASMNLVKSEMIGSANWAWAMYSGLTLGAVNTILEYGTPTQKQQYLPKLVTGQWSGTMCLTEAGCGTDLGQIKTRAIPNPDGSYAITGTKIFISAGEHDLSDNIVHIVLARLPDAPKGTKGISLFIVPKFLPTDTGDIGQRNTLNCGGIEHKMGIAGSATCVINFDGATGFLLGKANKGLKAMFTYMNTARIGTGIQGLAHTELSFQNALPYAKERRSMRALSGTKEPDKPADAIIHHGDVRRMLLTQKAFAEGGRSMLYHVARYADHHLEALIADDKEAVAKYENKMGFFTPIIKGFLTELAIEATKHGQQIYGGHGYIKEWGMEQIARDARIGTLYEGTTGVQALDLLGRKVLMNGRGKAVRDYTAQIMRWSSDYALDKQMRKYVWALTKLCAEWNALTVRLVLMSRQPKNRDIISVASEDYLMYCGYVMMGYHWARMAAVAFDKMANGGEQPYEFYLAKVQTAQFYYDKILPRTHALAQSMTAPFESVMAMDIEHFGFYD